MKKSITKGFKKAIGIGNYFRDQNDKASNRSGEKIVVSNPVQQSSALTSAFVPESVQQLNDCFKKCSVSAIFLKRLIQTKRYELVSEAVTEIFKQTMIMLEGIKRGDKSFANSFYIATSFGSNEMYWMEDQQQRARNYLATLVKLSDNLSVCSSETEINLAVEMVDHLLEILEEISSKAEILLPQTKKVTRRYIHNSMEHISLDTTEDEFERSSIRRSFRTLRRKISSKTNVRHQSSDRFVQRRESESRSKSAKRTSNISSTSSTGMPSFSSKSTDSILDIQNRKYTWDSRPCSGTSSDLLSSCSSSIEPMDISQKDDEIIPPKLPPKATRPKLGGIHVYSDPVKRCSILLNDSIEYPMHPPDLPTKTSPLKPGGDRDSGYNEIRKSVEIQECQLSPEILCEHKTPRELLNHIVSGVKIEKDLLEIFLSSYRTFTDIHDLIDSLLIQIRQRDSCLKNLALQILIRVIDQMVYTELTDELHETLSGELFWMMTHRESEFMKFAQKLRDNIRKKWKSKQDRLALAPATNNEILNQLRECGQHLLEFSSDRIAQQITLIEAEYFRNIDSSEFVISSMFDTFDDRFRRKVPNFANAVDHFNDLSYWTQGIILSQHKESQDLREKIIWKLFHVLNQLKQQKNFNSYFALVSGVSSNALTRLNWSKSIFKERISEHQSLTDVDKNFNNYREILRTCTAPCIPYIGIIKRDLYQVHLREKSLDSDGCVNIKKARKLHNHLEFIRRFRNSKYDYQKNTDIIKVFGGFRCIHDEDILWSLSYKLKKESNDL